MNMDINYNEFRELNKKYSGSMSREIFVRNNFSEWYSVLLLYKKKNNADKLCFKELLYSYFNNDMHEKKCSCGKDLNFYSIDKGYSMYCSIACSNKGNIDVIRKIKLEKYGDPNFNNTDKFKKSIREKIAKDGNAILDKRRNTKLEKYGDPNFTNIEKIKDSKKNTTIAQINEKMSVFNVNVIDLLYDSSYTIYCNKCNKDSHILNSRINARLRSSADPCPVCNNYNTGVSSTENEVSEYIASLGFMFRKNDRKILNGMEIDIFIPSLNLGFEYNGLYWHSEMNLNYDYHIKKQDAAKDKGIRLINIWEDDWTHKKEIVKSKINHILGITNNVIFARKCKLEKIDFKLAKDFLNANHIQGFCPFKIAIGLVINNEIVSICTFGARKISGKSTNEILRFTNKINYHIPGAFTKIMNNYIKVYNPEELITFADRSWSPYSDNLYSNNGFEYLYSTKPNYWYIVDKKRVHRFNYRKDVLVKQGYPIHLTEKEIMINRGIHRIYDCGQYKYKLIVKNDK